MSFFVTDKQINHTDENNSRDKIQAIDTSHVSVYGKNSEAENEKYGNDNPCMPNYNSDCHYHQVFRQKTSCDNHEKHLSPNVENDEGNHHEQVVDRDYEYPSSPNERRKIFCREDRVSVTKMKGSKLRSGKTRNVSSTHHLSDKKGDRNEMCDHCHCAIKTTYTRQIRHTDAKKLEHKDKAILLDQMEPLFEDSTYTGKLNKSAFGSTCNIIRTRSLILYL